MAEREENQELGSELELGKTGLGQEALQSGWQEIPKPLIKKAIEVRNRRANFQPDLEM